MLNAPLIRNTRLSKEEYEARYRALQATLSQLNDIILEALSEDDVEDAEMIEVLFDFNRVAELERTLSLERSGSLLTIDSEEFVKASDCLHEMEAAEKTGTFLKTSSLSSLRTSDGGSSAGLDASGEALCTLRKHELILRRTTVLAKDCDLKAHVHLLISIIRDQPLRTNLEAALTYLLKSIEVLNSIDFDKTSPEELLKFKTQCEE
ncbi:hypothetical protein ONZ45_g4792 [Pleurotus djamor]|nr:hypothetical protein ONZ45_g4792 [Pleurotus djamor]